MWAALVFIASARVPVRVNAKSVGEGILSGADNDWCRAITPYQFPSPAG